MFGIKNGFKKDDFSLLLFNLILEYEFRGFYVNQYVLVLKFANKSFVYADDVNILVWRLGTVKENTKVWFTFNKEVGKS